MRHTDEPPTPEAAAAPRGLTPVSAARRVLGELHRARRTLLLHPDNDDLRSRCIEGLVDAATAIPRRLRIDLQEDHLYVDEEMVFAATAADNSFAPLFDAGVRRVFLSPAIATESHVIAILDLLSARVQSDDPTGAVRKVWAAAIPGIEFDYGEHGGGGGLRGARSFTALRLGAVPVLEQTPALRTAIEREIAVDPAVRIVASLFSALDDRDTPRCATEVRFVARMLTNALHGMELATAAAILAAAERCPLLDDEQRTVLIDAAGAACTAEWWQRAAESAGTECRGPLSAILLQVGIDRETADRVLSEGANVAAAAILYGAPDAPSPEVAARARLAQIDSRQD